MGDDLHVHLAWMDSKIWCQVDEMRDSLCKHSSDVSLISPNPSTKGFDLVIPSLRRLLPRYKKELSSKRHRLAIAEPLKFPALERLADHPVFQSLSGTEFPA